MSDSKTNQSTKSGSTASNAPTVTSSGHIYWGVRQVIATTPPRTTTREHAPSRKQKSK